MIYLQVINAYGIIKELSPMKTNKKSNKKALTLLVATLCMAIGVYVLFLTLNPEENPQPNVKHESGQNANLDRAKNPPTQPEDKVVAPNTDIPQPPTNNPSTNKQTVTMTSSVAVADSVVYIRGGIDNAVVYDGVCSLTMTGPSGQVVTRETVLLQNASTTDCKTMQFNRSSLSPGKWSYTLKYSSESAEGATHAQDFTVN